MNVARVLLLTPLLATAQVITLQQGLEEALTKGPEAEYIRISVDSSREVVREVRKAAFPTVTGFANAGVGRSPSQLSALGGAFGALGQSIGSLDARVARLEDSINPEYGKSLEPLQALEALNADPDEPTWSVTYGVQATQPLFTFGKVTTALRMASTQDRITKLSVRSSRIDIQTGFLGQWTNAVLAERKVGAIERSLKRQAETVAYLERSFVAGQGSKAQILMARSQMLKLQPDLLGARRDAVAARRLLNRTLGRSADDTTDLDTTGLPELEGRLAPSRDQLLQEALSSRNDLKSLTEVIGLQEDLVTIYRANYLPNIALTGKVGVISANTDMNEAFKEAGNLRDNYEWSVGVGMQWNLFDGFEQSAKAGQSRAAVHALQLKRNDLLRMVEIEVEKALLDRQAADSSLAAAREGFAAAVEARTLYETSFREGSGALSDVLSAEENQRMAELAIAAAQLERTRAAAQLALVRGQNLIALPEEP